MMEKIILETTDLGPGTCWSGGGFSGFSRSNFSNSLSLQAAETIAAVTPVGIITFPLHHMPPGQAFFAFHLPSKISTFRILAY
jgi:hypothetical protein